MKNTNDNEKPRKIRLLPRAEQELSKLPQKTQDKIIQKIDYLKNFPFIAPAMFGAYKGYRCLLAISGKYRIIYKIKSKEIIEIAYIRSATRQMGLRSITKEAQEEESEE